MNTAPYLLPEDRPEFERAVEEALHSAWQRPALAALGERLTAQQLRTMALSAATAIAACAAGEYENFVKLRTELRRPSNAPLNAPPSTPSNTPFNASPAARSPYRQHYAGGVNGPGLPGPAVGPEATAQAAQAAEAEQAEGLAEVTAELPLGGQEIGERPAGAGLVAMVSVLVPVLTGTAAVIFLLVGYLLRVMSPEPAIAATMRGTGWTFAALAATATVAAMAGVWLAAVRNGSSSPRPVARSGAYGGDGPALAEEVAKARAAWREALVERGIVPFIEEALADPSGARLAPASYVPAPGQDDGAGAGQGTSQDSGRTPRLGYSGPHFSSNSGSEGRPEDPAVRPRYSSPDYSSPDYGGPEHKPE